MASGNLDLVRRIYAAWERGDFSSAEWADPDIEFSMADPPLAGSWRGHPEMARAWREAIEMFEDFRVEPEEYRELDDGRVLVLLWPRHRGGAAALVAASA